jgi:GT2 family glycosyltransferase
MTGEMLGARQERRYHPTPLSAVRQEHIPCSLIVPVNDGSFDVLLPTLEAISTAVPAGLCEILLVNALGHAEARALLASMDEGVRVIAGEPEWSFAQCCNQAAAEAQGNYLVFLKPGFVPSAGWLEGLLGPIEGESTVGVMSGMVLNQNGLLEHVGVAFDVNQSPFSLYRLLPQPSTAHKSGGSSKP